MEIHDVGSLRRKTNEGRWDEVEQGELESLIQPVADLYQVRNRSEIVLCRH